MGAWIEMSFYSELAAILDVAPLVGAWIEIFCPPIILCIAIVAPLVGAWIEIEESYGLSSMQESLPSWERGLKSER